MASGRDEARKLAAEFFRQLGEAGETEIAVDNPNLFHTEIVNPYPEDEVFSYPLHIQAGRGSDRKWLYSETA